MWVSFGCHLSNRGCLGGPWQRAVICVVVLQEAEAGGGCVRSRCTSHLLMIARRRVISLSSVSINRVGWITLPVNFVITLSFTGPGLEPVEVNESCSARSSLFWLLIVCKQLSVITSLFIGNYLQMNFGNLFLLEHAGCAALRRWCQMFPVTALSRLNSAVSVTRHITIRSSRTCFSIAKSRGTSDYCVESGQSWVLPAMFLGNGCTVGAWIRSTQSDGWVSVPNEQCYYQWLVIILLQLYTLSSATWRARLPVCATWVWGSQPSWRGFFCLSNKFKYLSIAISALFYCCSDIKPCFPALAFHIQGDME